MSKRNDARGVILSISGGFAHGLAQMASGGRSGSVYQVRVARSAGEAFRGDWQRIGGDMTRAIRKARIRGSEAKEQ